MTDVILINPSYADVIYATAKIKVGVPFNPMLNLAMLAAPVLEKGFSVKILDLDKEENPDQSLADVLARERPAMVGITFTTPLYSAASRLATRVKELLPGVKVIAGGAHATTFPKEIVATSDFDATAIGEGDFIIRDLLMNKDWSGIQGLVYKKDGEVVQNGAAQYIENLDSLPFPAWQLYDLRRYTSPSLSTRVSPSGYLETSRGCPWGCVYCNKNIQGRKFRPKSVKRVVDEMEYMLRLGFKEIHILDDMFSTDIDRAKQICDEIVKRGMKFPWHPLNGLRVDRVDRELFRKMKAAGCYKVSFGIESGNQNVLDAIGKGITLEQARAAVGMAREIGFETFGFFMLGLPGDTEETMKDTIRFACELKLDFAKFNGMVPLPGTKIFDDWDKKGYLKTKDWDKYNFYTPYHELYDHPTLDQKTLNKYFRRAYFIYYFRPAYLWQRFRRSVKDGTLLRDFLLFMKTKWFS